jgi:hypothetical protein
MADIFGIRPTGVPFDVLGRLGTPAIAETARAMRVHDDAITAAVEAAHRVLAAHRGTPPAKLLARLADRGELSAKHLATYPELVAYQEAVRARAAALAALDTQITAAYLQLHDVLERESARELPDFLVIESESLAEDLARRGTGEGADALTSRDRHHDRKLALYLQRVCAKNDSISRFGPVAWGTVTDGEGVHVTPAPGVARRRVDVERWVVKALLELLDADPETRAEALPRLHPHGRFEGAVFVRHDEDREIALDDAEHALALRCDGATPAHALDPAMLDALVTRGVVVWKHEPMAIDVSPLPSLVADVARWRPGPVRARWLERLEKLQAIAAQFAAAPDAEARRTVMGAARTHLEEIGIGQRTTSRTLYAARNPLLENCGQDGTFTLGKRSLDALIEKAWPWFELYRDGAALASLRMFDRLHEVVRAAPRRNGVLSYSTLARVAKDRGLSIHDDHAHNQIGTETFAEIKRDFAAVLAARADAPEWQLTAEDCLFLRARQPLPELGGASLPSLDLQVMARSVEDAAAGRLRWVIAELHFPLVLVQHVLYWGCTDKPRFHAACAQIVDAPFFVGDSFSQAPVHACGEAIMSAVPRAHYVGAARPKPGWAATRPADAEVVVDEAARDVRLRSSAGEDLGSIVRTVRLLTGQHPFFPFEREPHQPRLSIGDVIVQRRAWTVDSAALGARPGGASAAFVTAIDRERAARGIPRWVFVRPAPGALRANAWFGRDKDSKPFYVDLESVVFLDILERRLSKYGTLVVTEMIPTPEELVWVLPDGRYTFELRTNLVPP